jgi:F-type H+-transporting ATPase subunit b
MGAGVGTAILGAVLAAENDPKDLYPHWDELIVGALAFGVLFFFVWKWVLPRLNQTLEERRQRIQGELETAERTRREADQLLAEYRSQLAAARDDANKVIEEARKTAEQLRRDQQVRAEQEADATVARAQEEIRAERDRVFQELRAQLGTLAVDLAGVVVGHSLDQAAHQRLIDQTIDQIAASGSNGSKPSGG